MKRQLSLKDIRTDGKTQQRAVDNDVVKRYAALIAERPKEFLEIDVTWDDNNYYLTDGYHRVAAYKKLNKKYIGANIIKGTKRDAIWRSFSANKKNAFPRQRGTAKGIIEKILKDEEWSKISQHDIARHVGCTQQFVSKIFSENKENISNNQLSDRTALSGSKKGFSRSDSVKVKRGKSEYEAKVPVKKVLDATKREVPEHLIDFFNRGKLFREPVRILNQMLKTVREGQEAGDQIYGYIKIENLEAQIGNVKRIFRFGLPYAVCGYCGGDENNEDCRACGGKGFVNEVTWRATPKEWK